MTWTLAIKCGELRRVFVGHRLVEHQKGMWNLAGHWNWSGQQKAVLNMRVLLQLEAKRIVPPNIACHGTEVHEQPELAMGAM